MKRTGAVLGGVFSISKPRHCRCQIRTLSDKATAGAAGSNGINGINGARGTPKLGATELKINKESKTIETPAGLLPISPLMDPAWQQDTKQFRTPKFRANTLPKSRFRRQLQKNPYAQALATPSRICGVTEVNLPRYFLQDFNLVQHPETKVPWWIPSSLAASSRPQQNHGTATSAAASEEPPIPAEDQAFSSDQTSKSRRPRGPACYVLSRQDLFKAFLSSNTIYHHQDRRLGRRTTRAQFTSVLNRTQWSGQMETLVLELQRRRAVEELLYLCRKCEEQQRKYIVKLDSVHDIKDHPEQGCILYIASDAAPAGESVANDAAKATSIAPGKDGMPVHDLAQLLGAAHVDRLRKESSLLREGTLFLLSRQRSAAAQLKLWKLRGYLSPF